VAALSPPTYSVSVDLLNRALVSSQHAHIGGQYEIQNLDTTVFAELAISVWLSAQTITTFNQGDYK
jgi:hypothetical protein